MAWLRAEAFTGRVGRMQSSRELGERVRRWRHRVRARLAEQNARVKSNMQNFNRRVRASTAQIGERLGLRPARSSLRAYYSDELARQTSLLGPADQLNGRAVTRVERLSYTLALHQEPNMSPSEWTLKLFDPPAAMCVTRNAAAAPSANGTFVSDVPEPGAAALFHDPDDNDSRSSGSCSIDGNGAYSSAAAAAAADDDFDVFDDGTDDICLSMLGPRSVDEHVGLQMLTVDGDASVFANLRVELRVAESDTQAPRVYATYTQTNQPYGHVWGARLWAPSPFMTMCAELVQQCTPGAVRDWLRLWRRQQLHELFTADARHGARRFVDVDDIERAYSAAALEERGGDVYVPDAYPLGIALQIICEGAHLVQYDYDTTVVQSPEELAADQTPFARPNPMARALRAIRVDERRSNCMRIDAASGVFLMAWVLQTIDMLLQLRPRRDLLLVVHSELDNTGTAVDYALNVDVAYLRHDVADEGTLPPADETVDEQATSLL